MTSLKCQVNAKASDAQRALFLEKIASAGVKDDRFNNRQFTVTLSSRSAVATRSDRSRPNLRLPVVVVVVVEDATSIEIVPIGRDKENARRIRNTCCPHVPSRVEMQEEVEEEEEAAEEAVEGAVEVVSWNSQKFTLVLTYMIEKDSL